MSRTSDLADRLADESTALDAEVREIDLLVSQARSESVRHETRRSTATDKLAALGSSTTPREAIDLANQAVTLTRRAALMDAQVEILEAKKKALVRLKQAVDDHTTRVHDLAKAVDAGGDAGGGEPAAEDAPTPGGATPAGGGRGRKARGAGDDGAAAPAVSRIILTAQEDLRREIARAMHDGPAQSLTNIVLQAEIVERLVGKDPAAAGVEVHQLVAMVQQTLEATKTFIFDVRPMVLDDLGLVPTLRRAARDRGRRAAIAVEFESLGQDQRLPVELESGLFRILDEALAGYLAARPDRISLRLDWAEELRVELATERVAVEMPSADLPPVDAKLPPALAAMVEERRADQAEAVELATRAAMIQLPPGLVRDITSRAETLGISAEILDDGGRLRLVTPVPGPEDDARRRGASEQGAGDDSNA
jgi:two-component system, NarL family, sensor histidine kinase DegS